MVKGGGGKGLMEKQDRFHFSSHDKHIYPCSQYDSPFYKIRQILDATHTTSISLATTGLTRPLTDPPLQALYRPPESTWILQNTLTTPHIRWP
jgi:hypothetical protein